MKQKPPNYMVHESLKIYLEQSYGSEATSTGGAVHCRIFQKVLSRWLLVRVTTKLLQGWWTGVPITNTCQTKTAMS